MDIGYSDSASACITEKFWSAEFKRGPTSLGVDESLGHPKTAIIFQVHQMVLDNRRIKLREKSGSMKVRHPPQSVFHVENLHITF